MEKKKVLIVDDSPFSQRIIKDALKGSAFEVCAAADTGTLAIEEFRKQRPDLVTMDMTLPDMDGLDCCSELKKIDPDVNIVVLSAMRDQKLIARGTMIGVKEFLQKPVKREELLSAMEKVLHQEGEGLCLVDREWLGYFDAAFRKNIKDMAGLESTISVQTDVGTKFISHGLAIIVGLTGTTQGRVIVDMATDVAERFASKMLGGDAASEDDQMNSVAEFANIIAGHGVSRINNINSQNDMDVRLTPPSILLGENLSIINPKLSSCTITAETSVGLIHMNVGFVRGR